MEVRNVATFKHSIAVYHQALCYIPAASNAPWTLHDYNNCYWNVIKMSCNNLLHNYVGVALLSHLSLHHIHNNAWSGYVCGKKKLNIWECLSHKWHQLNVNWVAHQVYILKWHDIKTIAIYLAEAYHAISRVQSTMHFLSFLFCIYAGDWDWNSRIIFLAHTGVSRTTLFHGPY